MGKYPKTEGKCSADDDCPKVPFRRGLCTTHYSRWKTHGDFTTVLKPGKPRQLGECLMDDCPRDAVARDLCGKHWQRWRKWGDPTVTKLDRDRTVEERFWEKVDKDGPVPDYRPELGPCWVWTASTMEGYGSFWIDGKSIGAHRMTYGWFVGEVPEGHEIDHLCRVRHCVNPAHLEAVTHWTNVVRGVSPWGLNAVKTHCPQGHEYDEENAYIYDGERHCRICSRERTNEWIRKTGWKSKAVRKAS
jgi:hypothetical protein